MLSRSQTLRVQAEGYEALMANKPPSANPYPWSDNERCIAWNAGYSQARTDRALAMTVP